MGSYLRFFRSGAWVKAEAAMDFIALVDFGSASTLAAFVATDFEVRSFLDMEDSWVEMIMR